MDINTVIVIAACVVQIFLVSMAIRYNDRKQAEAEAAVTAKQYGPAWVTEQLQKAQLERYTAEQIRMQVRLDEAVAHQVRWARDTEERKRREAGLGAMNHYTSHWQGPDGEKPVGPGWTVRGVASWKPEDYAESMKVCTEKLRNAGYTVTCTIKPPPATRKL